MFFFIQELTEWIPVACRTCESDLFSTTEAFLLDIKVLRHIIICWWLLSKSVELEICIACLKAWQMKL